MSSIFSSNSEAFDLELLEKLGEMSSWLLVVSELYTNDYWRCHDNHPY